MKNHSGDKNPNYKDGRFNGKRFTLRLPDKLHSKIVQAAKEREVSMNDLIVMWLETAVKGEIKEKIMYKVYFNRYEYTDHSGIAESGTKHIEAETAMQAIEDAKIICATKKRPHVAIWDIEEETAVKGGE